MIKAHSLIAVDLIQQYADHGVGAEIGVFRGMTSNQILTRTNTKMLYMIDQYKKNYDPKDWTYSKVGNPKIDYKKVKIYFNKHFNDKHTLINQSSAEASKEIDIELDFIFIDANHTYKHVLQDLNCWVPKVKNGGLIMGHDWCRKYPGVITAVINYQNKNKIFMRPIKPRPVNKLPQKTRYVPAPSGKPVVMKSWPEGHVWWALKTT